MRSSKKIVIAIIIVLILLLGVGGAFAYVYLGTDILKTDQELFFKYFAQITSEDGFIDTGIKNFEEKKKQTPYENSGEIAIDAQYPDESLNTIIDKVNDLSIKFQGNVDSLNQKVEQNIEVDYGDDVTFPITYRQDGNKFGLKIEKLSKQFIAIRNENLDDLIGKIIGEDITVSQNEVMELSDITELMQFTEEEKNQLKQIYGTIIEQELSQEKFSSLKTEQSESYILELSNEQIKNIIIKILEATKQNTLIIDKVNDIMAQYDNEDSIEAETIEELINSIKEEDFSTLPNLKLTLVQSNKQLNQIIIQLGENQITIQKNKSENNLNYTFDCFIKGENVDTNSLLEETSEAEEMDLCLKVQYSGLDNLSDVQENYEIGFDISAEEKNIVYNYKINCNTKFTESVLIETLDDEVAIFLNDHNDEQVTKFLTQVGTKILEINKNQMTKLGLKEYENPLLYSNPITTILLSTFMMYNSASDAVEDSMVTQEIQVFNNQFISYVGDERRGSEVKAMVNTVLTSNLSYEGIDDKIVKLTIDGIEISDSSNIDTSSLYKVEAVYNDNGYVTEMKITTNQ